MSPALAGRFFTTNATWEVQKNFFKKEEMDMKTHFVSDIHFAFWLSFIKQFFQQNVLNIYSEQSVAL